MADRLVEKWQTADHCWESGYETETDGSDDEVLEGAASHFHPHSAESNGDERSISPNSEASHYSESQETTGADSSGSTAQAETKTEDGPSGLSDLEADVCSAFKPSAKGMATKPKATSSSLKRTKSRSKSKPSSKTKKTAMAETCTCTKVNYVSRSNNVVFGKQEIVIVGMPGAQPQRLPRPPTGQQFPVPDDITSSETPVSQGHIHFVSTCIGMSWMVLAHCLLPGDRRQVEMELQNIEAMYETLNGRAYHMLQMWLQRVPDGTVGDLALALVRIGMDGIAVLLQSYT